MYSAYIVLDWTAMLLVFECTLLAYINAFAGEFVFDDLLILELTRRQKNTGEGGGLRDLLALRFTRRALLHFTFRRDMLLHGLAPYGWHATNIAIHLISAELTYAMLRYWFEPEQAIIGALMFALHPLATASVTSISGRSSALCGMFYLSCCICFLARAWGLIPILAYLGYKSKEEIVTIPLTLAALWYWG